MKRTMTSASARPNRQHFRAKILRQGPNPYVDVPRRISRAFAAYARAGRIHFEGTLNGVAIRGSLVPLRRGGHRLYVNGGMRAAAAVAVGDTASFALRATHPEDVPLPAEVAAGFQRVRGARAAFQALIPSYRRQLLRYIDDARTPETRRRRIETAAAHVLGQPTPRARRGPERPSWTCPRCGNEFVNRNQSHSCKRHDLSEVFSGKPARVRELFDRFRAMVEAIGPVRMLPYHDRVAFMVQVRFAGAFPKREWLEVGFWLPRRIESPRFRRVETIAPNVHIHLLRVTEERQLDRELAGWLKEAYAVGRREHLRT
ncbi:MAG: YdeI/OmpD-associated family protein [Thermoanaerobaculia bacterium]